MRILLLGITCIALTSCGNIYGSHINTDLQTYVNRFLQVAQEQGYNVSLDNLIVDYERLSGNVIGVCYLGGVPKVGISESYWKRLAVSNSDREQLMFHELGHCLLGRGHLDIMITSVDTRDPVPESIMRYMHFSADVYNKNWIYYMKELFFHSPQPMIYAGNVASQFPGQVYDGIITAPGTSNNSSEVRILSAVEKEVTYITTVDDINNPEESAFHCGEEF